MTTPAVLSGLTGNCTLQSSRFQISSDGIFGSSVVKPTSSSQAFGPESPEFQQLGSFYYAQSLKSLVVDALGASLSGRVTLDAHCNQADNAYFSPISKVLCFGYHNDSGKKVWAADDADVVIHEVGHSMNHGLASTSILNSSNEAGAIDESIADYWALTVLNDGQLAEWFLGVLGASYIRDATGNHNYPSSLQNEIHDDSRILTELLWDLRDASNLGKSDTDKLVKRALQLLPSTSRMGDFYEAFYDASGPSFINLSSAKRNLIVTKFTNKGIHRTDSAAGLRLSTSSTQVHVIDDHSFSFLSGGNCNGTLDVGETALVMVNLENPAGAAMGVGVATLGSFPAGTSVPSGGEVGEFFRLNPTSDFVSSLPPAGSSRDYATMMASFVVKASSAGAKAFSLTFRPMHADPTGGTVPGPDVNVSFSLNVGTTATSSGCTNNSLWP